MNIPCLLIHSSVGGHLDSFQFLAIGNNVAINTHLSGFEHLFSIILGIHLGVELLGHMVVIYLMDHL